MNNQHRYFVWLEKYCQSVSSNTFIGIIWQIAKAHMMRIRWFKLIKGRTQGIIVWSWIIAFCLSFWALLIYFIVL
jgi:hypothetical protein